MKLFVILKLKYQNEGFIIIIFCTAIFHIIQFILNILSSKKKTKVNILLEYDKFDRIHVIPENIQQYGNTNNKNKKFRVHSSL